MNRYITLIAAAIGAMGLATGIQASAETPDPSQPARRIAKIKTSTADRVRNEEAKAREALAKGENIEKAMFDKFLVNMEALEKKQNVAHSKTDVIRHVNHRNRILANDFAGKFPREKASGIATLIDNPASYPAKYVLNPGSHPSFNEKGKAMHELLAWCHEDFMTEYDKVAPATRK